MDVSVENTGGLARRMIVQVPGERVEQEVESRLQSMTRTMRLDGFRAGKVPLKVVEKRYGKQVRLEVINQLVNSTMQEAFSKENLRPVGNPNIETKASTPGEPLEYVVTFEVFPEVHGTINYNFSVVRPIVQVVEDDVTGMLENLRRQRATWKIVDRSAQSGDQVVIDFEGSIDGRAFSGNKASNMPVVIGSGSMVSGFEAQLAGLSAGSTNTVKVEFPADYPSAEVAGKKAEFAVKVQSVSELVLPEMDDSFAKSFGIESGGMDGLRTDVTNNMRRELKGLIASRIKEQVFNGLLQNNPVDAPKNLVDKEQSHLRDQQSSTTRSDAELRALAEKRVKLGVLVSELAKRNHVQIDPSRVREMVETIASSYETPDEVVQWYYSNQEMLANVQSSVIEEQVAEWVMQYGGIEVIDQQLSFNQLVEESRRTQGLQA
jgi:trigger factor